MSAINDPQTVSICAKNYISLLEFKFENLPFEIEIHYVYDDATSSEVNIVPSKSEATHSGVYGRLIDQDVHLGKVVCGPTVWIHDFLLGEEQTLQSFLDALRQQRPGLKITDCRKTD